MSRIDETPRFHPRPHRRADRVATRAPPRTTARATRWSQRLEAAGHTLAARAILRDERDGDRGAAARLVRTIRASTW